MPPAAQSRMRERPVLAVYAGVAILLVPIGVDLLDDTLRDALNPTSVGGA